ncbi:MAG TPA: hypothetical protein DCR14_09225 [Acidimicrobiaceae bacterium]|nr:hypothetical protein [Acidimicrobiaceae bacterium]
MSSIGWVTVGILAPVASLCMVGRQLGRLAGKVARAAKPLADKAKATDFARSLKDAYVEGRDGTADTNAAEPVAVDPADDTNAVAEALRSVDWAKVRAATAERTSDAAQRMKAMAAEVDWSRVQAGAAHVSSALIAAVASGQIPVGGRLAGPVARAIINDRDIAQRVSTSLQRTESQPPDFRGAIEATSRDAD